MRLLLINANTAQAITNPSTDFGRADELIE
jgi:hypothetical protein